MPALKNDQIKQDNLKIILNDRYGSYMEQRSEMVQQKFDHWKNQKRNERKTKL